MQIEWTRHTRYHWSTVINGYRVDYWPTTSKYMFEKQVRRGDPLELCKELAQRQPLPLAVTQLWIRKVSPDEVQRACQACPELTVEQVECCLKAARKPFYATLKGDVYVSRSGGLTTAASEFEKICERFGK